MIFSLFVSRASKEIHSRVQSFRHVANTPKPCWVFARFSEISGDCIDSGTGIGQTRHSEKTFPLIPQALKSGARRSGRPPLTLDP
jgi:hypothetical protein